MIHPTNDKSLLQKIIWHLKIVIGAVVGALSFSLVLRHELIHDGLPNMFILIFIQLEFFIWFGNWFFKPTKTDVPNFLQKLLSRLLMFYLMAMVISFTMFLGIYAYHYFTGGGDISHFFADIPKLEIKFFFIAIMIGFGFGAFFFFYSQLAESLKREQKLKEEKLIFQYETLKSQVNPHFLFNSLNSLSSLIKSDPDVSEEFVLKLASVYRYILENTEKELIPLSTELEFVQNYFALQKIRDGEKISLKIEILDSDKMFVLPVSLQLLVENALKHNSATRINPLEIIIHNSGIDRLVVRNNVQTKMQLKNSSKIGLKNLNERSRLILNREIEVLESNEEFVVKIPVKVD